MRHKMRTLNPKPRPLRYVMEKKMEITGIIGKGDKGIIGLYWDNGKEHVNY